MKPSLYVLSQSALNLGSPVTTIALCCATDTHHRTRPNGGPEAAPGTPESQSATGDDDTPVIETLKEGDRAVFLGKGHYGAMATVMQTLGTGLTKAGAPIKTPGGCFIAMSMPHVITGTCMHFCLLGLAGSWSELRISLNFCTLPGPLTARTRSVTLVPPAGREHCVTCSQC